MIVESELRGTLSWRAAHVGRVTASDAAALLAGPETKSYHALVERLRLDVEGVADHTVEEPDPWTQKHELELAAGLHCYRKHRRPPVGPVRSAGFVVHSVHRWLGCSPHGLIAPDGVLLIHPHRSLKMFHVEQSSTRAERAREQIILFVTDASWMEVCEYWNGNGQVADKLRWRRVDTDSAWLTAHIFPRFVKVWRDVAELTGSRSPAEAARRAREHRETRTYASQDDIVLKTEPNQGRRHGN